MIKKKHFIYLLESILIGLVVGIVVGIYQLGMREVINLSSNMFHQKDINDIIFNILIVILLSILNYLIIYSFKGVDGSGIPLIEKVLDKRLKVNYYEYNDLGLTIINSYASSYSLLTLGSEGPSVSMGGKIGRIINKIFNDNDNLDNIALGSGAAFGAAFLSPLSGFFYSLEDCLHYKTNFSLIFRSLIISFVSFFVSLFINNNHLISFDNVISFTFLSNLELIILITILVSTIILTYIFKKLTLFIRKLFLKYKNKFLIKYRSFIFFGVFLVLGYFIFDYLGNGKNILNLISDPSLNNSLLLLIGLFVFRLISLSILGNGKVSGGIVLPSMVLGGIIGAINFNLLSKFIRFDQSDLTFVILLSMILFFTLINNSPLTGCTLFISSLLYLNNYSLIFFKELSFYLCLIIIICGSLFFKFVLKEKNINEDFIKIDSLFN